MLTESQPQCLQRKKLLYSESFLMAYHQAGQKHYIQKSTMSTAFCGALQG